MLTLALDLPAIKAAVEEWPRGWVAEPSLDTRSWPRYDVGRQARTPMLVVGDLFGVEPAATTLGLGLEFPSEAIAEILALLAKLAAKGYRVLLPVPAASLERAAEFFGWWLRLPRNMIGADARAHIALDKAVFGGDTSPVTNWAISGLTLCLRIDGDADLRPVLLGNRPTGSLGISTPVYASDFDGLRALPSDGHGLAWSGEGDLTALPEGCSVLVYTGPLHSEALGWIRRMARARRLCEERGIPFLEASR